MRIEDVDTTRSVPGAADDMLRTLEAFALHWDGEVVRQSTRGALYEEALARLRERGLVYRCRCSRREVADSGVPGSEGAVYPGTCRALALAQAVDGADRMRAPAAPVEFEDRVQGSIAQRVDADVGDYVLRRRDRLVAYQLAVVVDDHEQGITDVVRGADLLWSTPRQIVLQRALGFATPRYLHLPVAANAAGEKLSKQTRAQPVERQAPGPALAAALRFLGQPEPAAGAPAAMLAQAVARWDPQAIPRHTLVALPQP